MDTASSNQLREIASYWMGPRLSFLEQLCLKSFADLGHPTSIYTYEPLEGVPENVTIKDGRDILPQEIFDDFKARGHAAVFSDKFRLHMIVKTGAIWVDCDAYAWQKFPELDYIFAGDVPTRLATGVLVLPKDSEGLREYIDFVQSPYPKFPENWPFQNRADRQKSFLLSQQNAHICDMPMWSWGPVALTYFLKKSGEIDKQLPKESLYPLEGFSINQVFRRQMAIKRQIPDDCLSVHLFGSLLRRKLRRRFPGGDLPENSFLNALCIKHDIDPRAAPVI